MASIDFLNLSVIIQWKHAIDIPLLFSVRTNVRQGPFAFSMNHPFEITSTRIVGR